METRGQLLPIAVWLQSSLNEPKKVPQMPKPGCVWLIEEIAYGWRKI